MVPTTEVGTEITPVIKNITQERINLFEACGLPGDWQPPSFHTDPEHAMQLLGMRNPIASGRMSLSIAAEALRRFFGPEVFNHSGTVRLKFFRPISGGDTVTVRGRVMDAKAEEKGTEVTVEVWCENQNGDKTAVGTGGAFIPK